MQKPNTDWKKIALLGVLGAATAGVWALGWGYDGIDHSHDDLKSISCYDDGKVPEGAATDNICNVYDGDIDIRADMLMGFSQYLKKPSYATDEDVG